MSIQNHSVNPTESLRRPIQANIAFSGLSILVLLVLGGELTQQFDFDPSWFLRATGVVLIPWLGILFFIVRQNIMQPLHVLGIAIADTAWVILSVIALLGDVFSLNTTGQWAVLMIADIVAMLAVWEFVALWRIRQS